MNRKASPTKPESDSETITIREDQVVGYLRRNPDFFARHDDLLLIPAWLKKRIDPYDHRKNLSNLGKSQSQELMRQAD